MPFKRPPSPFSSSSPSQSSLEPPSKQLKPDSPSESSASPVIRVYIVQAKLDAKLISELFSLVETNSASLGNSLRLELCKDVREAGIIITAIRMRRRLERHLDWGVAKEKAIVLPQWLVDSVQHAKALPCGSYAALQDLRDETVQNCPDHNNHKSPSLSLRSSPRSESASSSYTSDSLARSQLSYTSRYACCRAAPLICPNQGLAAELQIIRISRQLEGEDRSALSYSRAIAAIKAYPRAITNENLLEVGGLPFLGAKLLTVIKEYVHTGQIQESRNIANSSRFMTLSSFAAIYGIGPTTARRLYALGLRTIKDLESYYSTSPGLEDSPSLTKNLVHPTIDTDGSYGREQHEEATTEMSIKLALALKDDLAVKIPRTEVEEMHEIVMHELHALQEGCVSIIVGGYRRGKPESNDVDIVISHPDLKSGADRVKDLCKRLVRRLYDRGLVTHVMHLSSFHEHNALRTSHWDSLEKALTVFILPPHSDGTHKRLHRRLDLIFAAPEVYWTAVVGWTGSTMFERDLRLWAKEKGLKFDSSGMTRRRDSKAIFAKSEQEVFDVLGLEWVDPTMRNADA